MRVVMLSPEVYPYAKTGGLADVLAALPRALAAAGVEVTVCMPGYRPALRAAGALAPGTRLHAPIGSRMEPAEMVCAPGASVPTVLVRADQYFDRDGLYGEGGRDWPDNAERFAFFCRAALEWLRAEGEPALRRRDPDARVRRGPRRRAARPPRGAPRHPERDRRRRLESGHRPAPAGALPRGRPGRQGPLQAGAPGRARARGARRRTTPGHRLPPGRAEGVRPPRRGPAPRARALGRRARGAGQRRGALRAVAPRAGGPLPGARRGARRLRRGTRAPHRGGGGRLLDAVALRALRPEPALQPALWDRAHRARDRGPRRQRGGVRSGDRRGHGLQVQPLHARRLPGRARARAPHPPRPRALGPPDRQRHGAGLLVEPGRGRVSGALRDAGRRPHRVAVREESGHRQPTSQRARARTTPTRPPTTAPLRRMNWRSAPTRSSICATSLPVSSASRCSRTVRPIS